jgi:hypothetical protein
VSFGAPQRDARARVRDAVRRLVTDPTAWPPATWQIFRNRLLDEVGSDQRSLIQLVVSAGELGLVDQLPSQPLSDAAWRTARTPLVLTLIGDSFLQPEAAQWAVDVWGYATGVITAASFETSGAASAAPPAPARATWSAPATRSSAPPRAVVRPAAPYTPRTVAPPPKALKYINAVSLVVIVVGTVWFGVATVRRGPDIPPVVATMSAPGALATNTVTPAAPPAAALEPPLSAPVASPTAGALPGQTAEQAREQRVAPAQRAGVPNALVTRIPPAALQAAQPGVDQVFLKDGRSLIGRVDIIRSSDIVFREASTGLRYEFPRIDVAHIITEFGSVVRFEGDVRASPAIRALLARGLSGVMTVRYARREVQGSTVCASLWSDNPPDDRVTIRHRAGDDTLSFAFEGGATLRAVVDRDGLFNTSLAIVPNQAFAATAVTTRLSGRFVETGIEGTMTVIGYRRVRGGGDVTCTSILDATGRR